MATKTKKRKTTATSKKRKAATTKTTKGFRVVVDLGVNTKTSDLTLRGAKVVKGNSPKKKKRA